MRLFLLATLALRSLTRNKRRSLATGFAIGFGVIALVVLQGFVNAIVPAENLEATALDAARRLAGKPPEALAIARRLMRGDIAEVMARIEAEVSEFRERLRSPEAIEAFTAFFEKRPPKFRKTV